MNIAENLSKNSAVIEYKLGSYNETNYSLRKTIFFPGDKYEGYNPGDILIRFNGKSVRAYIAVGKKSSFYDQTFGAGEITHEANVVDINKLLDYTFKYCKPVWWKLAQLLEKRTGIVVYEKVANGPQDCVKENYV